MLSFLSAVYAWTRAFGSRQPFQLHPIRQDCLVGECFDGTGKIAQRVSEIVGIVVAFGGLNLEQAREQRRCLSPGKIGVVLCELAHWSGSGTGNGYAPILQHAQGEQRL